MNLKEEDLYGKNTNRIKWMFDFTSEMQEGMGQHLLKRLESSDQLRSELLMNPDKQIEIACATLTNQKIKNLTIEETNAVFPELSDLKLITW